MSSGYPQLNDKPELFIPYLDSEELYQQFIAQLNKDFRRAGWDEFFSTDARFNFHELISLVADQLTKGQSSSLLNISQLLYAIDIDEKLTKQANQIDKNSLQFLAELIIKRELQKVILRKIF